MLCRDRKGNHLYIVFGVERFHECLYGRRFIVINGHKPLKSIFNISIISRPPRKQKLFLHLQKYDFEFQYSPVKDMVVSDTLSRPRLSICEAGLTENSLIHQCPFCTIELTDR